MVIEPLPEDCMLLKMRGRDRVCIILNYLDMTSND